MVYYFFLNSFPEYEESSVDKPSSYQFDPEDTPRMHTHVSVQDCLLVLQNKPGLKTIALQGNIYFEMVKENIKGKKRALLGEEERKEADDNNLFEEEEDN